MENSVGELGVHFSSFVQTYGYFGIFLWFITIDQVTPIPDEISLITIGYLSAIGLFDFLPFAAIASVAAFLLVDTIEFTLSARGGSRRARRLNRKVSHSWTGKYKIKIQENFQGTLLLLTFIPRMRIFAPILAGAVGVPRKKFIAFDALGLSLFSLVYIGLGYFFHTFILDLFDGLAVYRHKIFLGTLLVLLVVGLVIVYKKRKYIRT